MVAYKYDVQFEIRAQLDLSADVTFKVGLLSDQNGAYTFNATTQRKWTDIGDKRLDVVTTPTGYTVPKDFAMVLTLTGGKEEIKWNELVKWTAVDTGETPDPSVPAAVVIAECQLPGDGSPQQYLWSYHPFAEAKQINGSDLKVTFDGGSGIFSLAA